MARNVGRTARQRRWVVLLSLVALVSVGLVLQAVHDLEFELDGDILTQGSTPFHTPTIDWQSLFVAAPEPAGAVPVSPLPTNFTAAGFERDFKFNADGSFNSSDDTTYATGSKDTLPISGWQCSHANNVGNKVDIANAYAAAYTDPNLNATGGHDQIIYFGLERNTNTGDANVAFWFLKDEVNCSSPGGGAVTFSGQHQDGDLLIVSAFTGGGSVSTIDVYRWTIDATHPFPGFLNPVPAAHGVDCRDPLNTGGDPACAAANTQQITVSPWITANRLTGVGNTLPTSDFFEGGVNLTKSNLAGCFNVFIAETRSSQSLTATLFDFARGKIGECTSKTETTPSIIGSQDIPGDPANASISVTDSAKVTVTGVPTFDGSVAFHLCGPSDPTGTDFTCATGGVDIGSKSTTNQTSPWIISSDAAVVTSAGRYCWRAEFTATNPSGIPDSTDNRASECFVINPRIAIVNTQATSGPVDFGQPISDTVTLTNTAHEPGTGGPAGDAGSINPTTLGGDATGNIVVRAYGPNSCSTIAFTSNPIGAAGNASYGGAGTNFQFTPTAPGLYVFVAQYSGDLPNTQGAGALTSQACNGAPDSEKVSVRQIPTQIMTKQSWIPNDTATITSAVTGNNLAAGGTVAFSLYDNATCTGTAKFSQSLTLVGGAHSEEVSTTNTTSYKVVTAYSDAANSVTALHSWKVVYTPAAADTAHTGIQSACSAEHFTITYTNDPGPGTALP